MFFLGTKICQVVFFSRWLMTNYVMLKIKMHTGIFKSLKLDISLRSWWSAVQGKKVSFCEYCCSIDTTTAGYPQQRKQHAVAMCTLLFQLYTNKRDYTCHSSSAPLNTNKCHTVFLQVLPQGSPLSHSSDVQPILQIWNERLISQLIPAELINLLDRDCKMIPQKW